MKLSIGMLLTCTALAHAPEGFLDVFIVKIRPEKRAEFNAIVKKTKAAAPKPK
jgi:hypothetical protein